MLVKTMGRMSIVILSVALCLGGGASAENSWLEKGASILETYQKKDDGSSLSLDDIAQGFKEALGIGAGNVVQKLGTLDGFNADANIHIPLPEKLGATKDLLSQIGMSYLLEDLELKLNRAAEAATPRAKALFMQSISEMTFEDVKSIYNGPENAATLYFKDKMSPTLAKEMAPIVQASLSEVGAVKAYDRVMAKYETLPFVPDVKANLTDHVLNKGMDGIFYYVAKEEAAIRKNPAKRTTDLLKRVFGNQ